MINLTMKNRGTWSLFCSVQIIEKKVRKSYVQDSHLGLHILPSRFPGSWCEMQGCSIPALLLMCSVRAGTSQNFPCFSFSIFAIGVATGVQLGKAL